MPGSKTAYLAQKLLDHALGGDPFTPPATLYLCLSTAAFAAAATGDSMSEITAFDYARIPVPNDDTAWTAAEGESPASKHNVAEFAFATAESDWGYPMSAYLADALTGGNLLFGADITNPDDVGVGDTVKVPATAFVFEET